MSTFIEWIPMIALLGVLDWGDLRESSKASRYIYVFLLFSAWAGWIYIGLVDEVPRIGNVLEKLTI